MRRKRRKRRGRRDEEKEEGETERGKGMRRNKKVETKLNVPLCLLLFSPLLCGKGSRAPGELASLLQINR